MLLRPLISAAGWQPLSDLAGLVDDVDRWFAADHTPTHSIPGLGIWTKDDAIAVTMDLPGVEPKDISVEITGDVLTISGQRQDLPRDPQDRIRYHHRERHAQTFRHGISLPEAVDGASAQARSVNGVLTVLVKRAAAPKPKTIAVSAT